MMLLHPLIPLSFKNALNDDTDLTIKLDCFTWRVDGDVLARKSGFFQKICDGNNWKESNERVVTLHDDNPAMAARLLQFLYAGDYCYHIDDVAVGGQPLIRTSLTSIQDILTFSSSRSASGKINKIGLHDCSLSESEIDLSVYDLADKYDIPSLVEYSLKECTANFLVSSSLSDLFIQHYPNRLKQDSKLKEVVVKLVALNFDSLRADKNEWANGVGKWLEEDFELCTAVMEKLSALRK